MWRLRLAALVLCLAAIAGVTLLVVRGRRALPPSVILVCVDTLRADHVHAAGYARHTTPNLDRLIAESVHFLNAYSQYTSTQLSIGSLFASRYPAHFINSSDRSALGRIAPYNIIPPELPVMAGYFKRHGYYTAAVLANPHLSPDWGYGRGFDEVHMLSEDPNDPEHFKDFARAPKLNEVLLKHYDAWLSHGKPLFVYLHYMDPHMPYLPLEPYKGRYGKGIEKSERLNKRNIPARHDYEYYTSLTSHDAAYMIARYDEEICYWDDHFARLLAALKARRALDNALLVVFADHGEQFLEHGHFGHGSMCTIEEVHVPLVFHGLGLKPRQVDRPVGLVDVFPTLVDLIAQDSESLRFAEGTSLAGLLRGRRHPKPDDALVLSQGSGTFSVRSIRESYVLYHAPERLYGDAHRRFPAFRLPEIAHHYFRLDADPAEQRNLFPTQRDAVARLNFILRRTFGLVVSKDYWLGDDLLAPWLSGNREQLRSVLTVRSSPERLSANLVSGPNGGHVLEIANRTEAAASLDLTVKTKPNQVYLFALRFAPGVGNALRVALRDGDEAVLEDTVDAPVSAAATWTRATPIRSPAATLTVTLPPRARARIDRLHAVEVHFLSPRAAPRRALTEEQRSRLRGLGYLD